MSLRLRAVDGSLASWTPAAHPKVLLLADPAGAGPLTAARVRAVAAAAAGALTFMGYEPVGVHGGSSDLRVALSAGSELIVAPSSAEEEGLEARGFSDEDFHYFCLKTHPRRGLQFSWEGLSTARTELGALRASIRALSGVSLEPSSRGVTGYLHRFREALSCDFDFPEALSCVWDGLRPGALSPGSKAAFLRAAGPALGLGPSVENGS